MGCQSEVYIGDDLTFSINTHDPEIGDSSDADAAPTYRVYEHETATPILSGLMAELDAANTTGFYAETIACTAANGFEARKTYTIYIEALVDGHPGTNSYNFRVVEETALEATLTAIKGAGWTTETLKALDTLLDAIKAKTDTIGALTVTVTAPVATGGAITVIRGDDYLQVDGRELAFTGTTWPVLTAGTLALIVRFSTVASYTGVVTGAAAGYVELTDTQTAAMTPGVYDYDLQATLANGSVITLAQGDFTVTADVR